MTEIRRHYFLNEYCILASGRAKRPQDFIKEGTRSRTPAKDCPFCPGNETMTPPETAVYQLNSGQSWDVRCFENLYPALSPPDGYHEVIVETAKHDASPADFTDVEMELMVDAYQDRFNFYAHKASILYVSLFKNYKQEAGASIAHSHTQLIALPLMPSELEKERDVIKRLDRCPYCSIMKEESESSRVIFEDRAWIAFAPFYSRTPFEVWVIPKRHINNITCMDQRERTSFSRIFRDLLRSIKVVLDDPPYNYHFLQTIDEDYHLNIRILPKLAIAAGFELNTGTYILAVPPEDAAGFLRGV
jgi:UDPglucose--hexose-1-phosphate uridylyltransferase